MTHDALKTANALVNHDHDEQSLSPVPGERSMASMNPTDEKNNNKNGYGVADPPALQNNKPSTWLSVTLLITRLFVAALFIFSGAAKLGFLREYGNSPVEFATAIRHFKVLHYDLIPQAAYIIPWMEVVCGLSLVFGLMTRGAAVVLNMLLIAFIGGMILVIVRGINVEDCSCFGGKLAENFGLIGEFLEAPIGPISVLRNLFLMALCTLLLYGGSGFLGLDRLTQRR